jgi:CheY-like chemotaxis protein
MPLVDGMMSTKMIRRFERELEDLQHTRPRVPIIAVSASLSESKRFDYIQSGYGISLIQRRLNILTRNSDSMHGY